MLALVVATNVPFWGKAFHVDDAFFIAIAKNVRDHPLRPFAGAVALDDTDQRVFARLGRAPNTFETLSHPPLVPYAVAAASAVGGLREIPIHAAFVVFPVIAAVFQYRLARRFIPAPLSATLLLVSCPLFIIGSQGLMTDVPALALFLAGLCLFIEGTDSSNVRKLLLAGLAGGLACLTRYVCLGLVPIAALYAFTRRPRPARAVLALVPFLAVLGLWVLQNQMEHGSVHLAASARHYAHYYEGRFLSLPELGRRLITDLAALGGTLLPLAVLLARDGRHGQDARIAASVLGAAALVWLNPFELDELPFYEFGEKAALNLCLGAALFLLAEALHRARPLRSDRGFLLLWLGSGLLATVLLLPFGAARYMIPITPPLLVLLCAGHPGESWADEFVRHDRGAQLTVALTLGLGLLLAVADYRYAGVYRDFTRCGVPAVAGKERVWFIGDWGFRFYMERAGHRYLSSTDDTATEGDIVIRPQIAGLHQMSPGLRGRAQAVATLPIEDPLPFRLMSHEANAGYYSHAWGLLPYAVSDAPLELFDVFRVVPRS